LLANLVRLLPPVPFASKLAPTNNTAIVHTQWIFREHGNNVRNSQRSFLLQTVLQFLHIRQQLGGQLVR